MRFKFNREKLCIEGLINNKVIFIRDSSGNSYYTNDDGSVDTFLVSDYDNESVRTLVIAERNFFKKHNIDKNIISELLIENREFIKDKIKDN